MAGTFDVTRTAKRVRITVHIEQGALGANPVVTGSLQSYADDGTAAGVSNPLDTFDAGALSLPAELNAAQLLCDRVLARFKLSPGVVEK